MLDMINCVLIRCMAPISRSLASGIYPFSWNLSKMSLVWRPGFYAESYVFFMKDFIRLELAGWKPWEVVWLLFALLAVVAISLIQGETLLGIISATTGTICVILTGKGKLSAYVLGLMNVLLYADIAYRATLYGETMLNLLYYLPMQFVGWFSWKNIWIPIMEKC